MTTANTASKERSIVKTILSRRALRGFFMLTLVAGVAAGIVYLRNNAGITTIDPARPPESLLVAAELEKLTALQNTQDVFLLSDVSPDDSTVIVAAGASDESGSRQASWMNIQTGALEPITDEFLELPPQSAAVWSGDETVVYVSNNETGDPILVTLDRTSGGIKSEALPINGRPLSLAPNGSRAHCPRTDR